MLVQCRIDGNAPANDRYSPYYEQDSYPLNQQFPSFSSLRAFEATARHLSFSAAASELCLTQSAISHQVKALEEFMGVQLLLRNSLGVKLTRRGAKYHARISPLIESLQVATQQVKHDNVSGPLYIHASPSFAALWLLPRIKIFNMVYPDIELNVITTGQSENLDSQPFDIRINCAYAMPPSLNEEAFMASPRMPVCSPELLKNGPPISKFEDILGYPLLREFDHDGWDDWFSAAGFSETPNFKGPRLENAYLTLKAAEDAQGITLGHVALITEELANGSLVRLFDTATTPELIYTITCTPMSLRQLKVTAFREWMLQEAKSFSVLNEFDFEQTGKVRETA
jgi:LysR family glycine cleavage system transcriptional activator